jgi:hypothetical protein
MKSFWKSQCTCTNNNIKNINHSSLKMLNSSHKIKEIKLHIQFVKMIPRHVSFELNLFLIAFYFYRLELNKKKYSKTRSSIWKKKNLRQHQTQHRKKEHIYTKKKWRKLFNIIAEWRLQLKDLEIKTYIFIRKKN